MVKLPRTGDKCARPDPVTWVELLMALAVVVAVAAILVAGILKV
jgi:hypothetical protein